MYSGIASQSHYFYVADQTGKEISIRSYFGKSASAVKKMYGAHLNKIADAKDTRAYKLGWDDQVEAGRKLLVQLRERGEKRGHWKRNRPESIQLIRVDILRDDEGIVKEKKFVLEIPAAP